MSEGLMVGEMRAIASAMETNTSVHALNLSYNR